MEDARLLRKKALSELRYATDPSKQHRDSAFAHASNTPAPNQYTEKAAAQEAAIILDSDVNTYDDSDFDFGSGCTSAASAAADTDEPEGNKDLDNGANTNVQDKDANFQFDSEVAPAANIHRDESRGMVAPCAVSAAGQRSWAGQQGYLSVSMGSWASKQCKVTISMGSWAGKQC